MSNRLGDVLQLMADGAGVRDQLPCGLPDPQAAGYCRSSAHAIVPESSVASPSASTKVEGVWSYIQRLNNRNPSGGTVIDIEYSKPCIGTISALPPPPFPMLLPP